jgi:TPR repeat protein
MLPDISTLKISELKAELQLYGINITGLSEKQDLISALKTAREELPRPPPAKDQGSKANDREDDATTTNCCAECGKAEGGDVSLKTCKSCKTVKYCGATCQRNHWSTHKKLCKLRAAELRDDALFKDPPPKEDCPICFLPMPMRLICCASLPPATRLSVPIYDFAIANEGFVDTEEYFTCCGKCICKGCIHSLRNSGNNGKCPYCNSNRVGKTDEEMVEEIMKRVEANDAAAIGMLAQQYYKGLRGFQQDHNKAVELWTRAADLGCSDAHNNLADEYRDLGDMKKAKFHSEAAAMEGNEIARYNLGIIEYEYGNMERAVKHWTIAASAGEYQAMYALIMEFEQGVVSRESIDSILKAYNSSCAEMRSKSREMSIVNAISVTI